MPAERLTGWVERFGGRHGELSWAAAGEEVTELRAADGATAVLRWPLPGRPVREPADLAARCLASGPRSVVLVRRGGWAVGTALGSDLVRSRCGTRYVQGKTKAGGWSQQRYARRRAQQADSLLDAAVAAVYEVLAGSTGPVVLGGDSALLNRLLGQLAGTDIPARVVRRRLDVPDPRLAVLQRAVHDAAAVDIDLNEVA